MENADSKKCLGKPEDNKINTRTYTKKTEASTPTAIANIKHSPTEPDQCKISQ